MSTMRPSRTATDRLHPSGQSSGQAVVTWTSGSTARGSAMAKVYHCCGHGHSARRDHRGRIRRAVRRARLPARARAGDARRSSQPPRVSAPAVSSGHGRALAWRYRVADSLDPPGPEKRPGAAGRGAGDRRAEPPGPARRRRVSGIRLPDPRGRRHMMTTVIVGGGPTGVEMAGAIAEIAHQTLSDEFQSIRTAESRIVLAEAGPTILANFPERLRSAARKSLLKLGVEVRENTAVTRVEHEAVWLGDERIEAGTIILAAGITASPLGKTLGAPTDRAGRVLVHKDLTMPGHPEVFVVGDLASLTDEDGHPYPGVAQVAMQQAQQAARNVIRAIENQPHAEFHYKNLGNMATIGRNAAIADLGWLQA